MHVLVAAAQGAGGEGGPWHPHNSYSGTPLPRGLAAQGVSFWWRKRVPRSGGLAITTWSNVEMSRREESVKGKMVL